MGEDFASKLQAQPTLSQTLAPIQAQRPTAPLPANFRPSVGRRIGRGVLAGVEGLARGGIRGAVLGAVDPRAVGATPYNAPTRGFTVAQQQYQARQAALDKQQSTATDAYKEDTGRAKDVITSINDIGKNYAQGENANARKETADARAATAQVQAQLADIKQEVAEYQSQGRVPTTYEATVTAAALEKDPVRQAALDGAAKRMEATEIKKFQYKAAADNAPRSEFRQSMIDAATSKIQALRDAYKFNPRTGMYQNTATTGKDWQLTPQQFADKKNEIAAELDSQLGAKKFPKLGVRFNIDDTSEKPSITTNGVQSTAPNSPATPTTPAQPAPKAGKAIVQDGGGQQLTDKSVAQQYLQAAGGDKGRARQLAQQDNWKF
jgi:hypothetical protein